MKGIIFLVILLFSSGPSFSAEEGPAVWLFAAQPERYFPAFFEVHLKRVLPIGKFKIIDLYAAPAKEIKKRITPEIGSSQLIILMDFNKELVKAFFLACQKISFQTKPFLIVWNTELNNIPDQFHFIPIIIDWDELFNEINQLIPPSSPIVLYHQCEPVINEFFHSFSIKFPHRIIFNLARLNQSVPVHSVFITSNEVITKELLSSQKFSPSFVLCLESSTFVLAEINSKVLDASLDFKPSQLAKQIPYFLNHHNIDQTIRLVPELILPNNLAYSDSYEAFRRCFSCW